MAKLLTPERLVGLDVDAELIETASERMQERGVAVGLYVADVRDMPFADHGFDTVIDFGTCHHISNPEQALREVVRVLKAGGLFVAETVTSQLLSHPFRSKGQRLPWHAAPELSTYKNRLLWKARTRAWHTGPWRPRSRHPAIAGLHNALLPTTTVTWTEELETIEHRAAWFERQQRDGYPVLVAENAGEVVGFTCYEPFRGDGKWPGYRATAELSIHVRESHWGLRAGRALVEALMERARNAGIHVLVAAIDSENQASIGFHQRLGFVEVGRLPQTGQKFGRWLDLVLMQRILDDRTDP